MDISELKNDLLHDEGFVSAAYQDHLGYWTIGIGRLIDKRRGGGITIDEAMYLLDNDVKRTLFALKDRWPHFEKLSAVRQRAVMNMAFQLGIDGFMKFKKAITAMEIGNFQRAALELRDSKWYSQTPSRAKRICAMIETNKGV